MKLPVALTAIAIAAFVPHSATSSGFLKFKLKSDNLNLDKTIKLGKNSKGNPELTFNGDFDLTIKNKTLIKAEKDVKFELDKKDGLTYNISINKETPISAAELQLHNVESHTGDSDSEAIQPDHPNNVIQSQPRSPYRSGSPNYYPASEPHYLNQHLPRPSYTSDPASSYHQPSQLNTFNQPQSEPSYTSDLATSYQKPDQPTTSNQHQPAPPTGLPEPNNFYSGDNAEIPTGFQGQNNYYPTYNAPDPRYNNNDGVPNDYYSYDPRYNYNEGVPNDYYSYYDNNGRLVYALQPQPYLPYNVLNGQNGHNGYNGYNGQNEYNGPNEYSGYNGPNEYSGFNKQNEYNEPKAYSGYNGPNEYSGFNRKNEYNGPNAYSGYNGANAYSGYNEPNEYNGLNEYNGQNRYSRYNSEFDPNPNSDKRNRRSADPSAKHEYVEKNEKNLPVQTPLSVLNIYGRGKDSQAAPTPTLGGVSTSGAHVKH